MPLTLDENNATYQIRAYAPGQVRVNDETYTASIIVSPRQLITTWPPQKISELTQDHLNILIELHPAILLIGTGSKLEFPPLEIYGDLINAGIGVEVMDTHAACRTYNALSAEERNVIAALIIQ
jgi:uncharacterized protein